MVLSFHGTFRHLTIAFFNNTLKTFLGGKPLYQWNNERGRNLIWGDERGFWKPSSSNSLCFRCHFVGLPFIAWLSICFSNTWIKSPKIHTNNKSIWLLVFNYNLSGICVNANFYLLRLDKIKMLCIVNKLRLI